MVESINILNYKQVVSQANPEFQSLRLLRKMNRSSETQAEDEENSARNNKVFENTYN